MPGLFEALTDLKTEVLNGNEVANVVESVAKDHGVHPKLLERKFIESYRSAEAVRANATQVEPAKADCGRVQDKINAVCARYGVSTDGVSIGDYKGVRYTIIGRRASKLVLVSHRDGQVWNLRAGAAIQYLS